MSRFVHAHHNFYCICAQQKNRPTLIKCFTRFSSREAKISGLQDLPPNSQKKSKEIGFGGYMFLVIPLLTFNLGVWQVKRRKWKLKLIGSMQQQLHAQPVNLPEITSELNDMEYRPIEVVGEFDHSRELIIHPRTRSHSTPAPVRRGPPVLGDHSGHGAQVVTPFKLLDRDNTEILINRGWVAKAQQDPETRKEGQITGPIKVIGILRNSEKRPFMVNENDPRKKHWFYRDVDAMALHLGTMPVYLEATYKSSVPGGPLGGQTNVTIRNEHWQYILTWFSLSGLTSYLWYLRFVK